VYVLGGDFLAEPVLERIVVADRGGDKAFEFGELGVGLGRGDMMRLEPLGEDAVDQGVEALVEDLVVASSTGELRKPSRRELVMLLVSRL